MSKENYLIDMFTNKFFADDNDINDLSDAALSRAFCKCVKPIGVDLYPRLRKSIIYRNETMKADSKQQMELPL